MEKMRVSVISVIERNGIVVARARVEAEKARIWVEIPFTPQLEATKANLWQEAHDQVLRYLDPN